jgi:hypothetical protein
MSSVAIKDHLELHQVLTTALERGHRRDLELQQQRHQHDDSSSGDYKIVLTGACCVARLTKSLAASIPTIDDYNIYSKGLSHKWPTSLSSLVRASPTTY